MGAPRFVLNRFWPSNLFLGGIPGAWYDPTDLSTMFQDSAGTTPVTAVEQPVGLILDKSQGLALGPELVTNGDFSGGTTGWTGTNVTLSIENGMLKAVSNAAGSAVVAQNATLPLTGRVLSRYYVQPPAGRSVAVFVRNNAAQSAITTTGVYQSVVQPAGTTEAIAFLWTAAAAGEIAYFDDITVRTIAGNHASQSTAASRPTYRARYNLLTFSEQFDNAYWAKAGGTISANTTLAPDGTTTADTWTATAGTSRHEMLSNAGAGPATVANANHTFTLYVKKGTHNFVSLLVTANNTTWYVATFDFSGATPVVSKTGAGAGGVLVSTSIEAAANGFWRLGVTGRTTDAVSVCCPVLASSATPTYGIYGEENWTAAGTETAIFWGAQLLTAADVTATGNAYQRIAAATVYDTAAVFRPYLAFDGVDDSLATAAINFTGQNKLTSFAGTSKFGGTLGMIVELSSATSGNAGGFYIAASQAASGDFSFRLSGTPLVGASGGTTSGVSIPVTQVLTSSMDQTGATLADQNIIRINATASAYVSTTGTPVSGGFGTWPLFIGRRNNASFPFNGRLFSLIVRGAASSVTEIADTELWVNARTGAY